MEFDNDVRIADEVLRRIARFSCSDPYGAEAGEELVLAGRGARIPVWDDDPE